MPTLRIHRLRRVVLVDGLELPLHPGQLRLLEIFSSAGHQWQSTEQLVQALHGKTSEDSRRALFQSMYSLRRVLGRLGSYIVHCRGKGYRCLLDVSFIDLMTPDGSILV